MRYGNNRHALDSALSAVFTESSGLRRTVVVLGSVAASLTNFRGPLIRTLAEAGHRVVAGGAGFDEQLAAAVRSLGAEPLRIEGENTGMNPLADAAYARTIKRAFDEIKPDVLLAYTAKPIVFGTPAARAAGAQTVSAMVTGLGYAFTEGTGLRRRVARLAATALYRRALPTCDVVMFQNPDDRDRFVSLGLLRASSSIALINGSGVDLERFSPGGPPSRTRSFLMISRLLGDKGVREYARAAMMVKKRHPEISFRLIGYFHPGPDAIPEQELSEWIKGGLEFLGRQEDVRQALRDCDVYVLPSYREGTPRSVLEAMSTGRAAITTDAPGCRETVVDGVNGLLTPVRNAEALANSMLRFIEQDDLAARMGREGRRIAEFRYDVRKVNAQIMSLLGLEHTSQR